MWPLDVKWLFNGGCAAFVQPSEGGGVFTVTGIMLQPAEMQDFLDKHPC